MKSIFCTSFAAPIGYYKAYLRSEVNILEKHEHYIKQTIRNRCEIATANGILILTVPLSERRNNMPVAEVRICYKSDWQRQHLKTLATAYKSSPFFEFYICYYGNKTLIIGITSVLVLAFIVYRINKSGGITIKTGGYSDTWDI